MSGGATRWTIRALLDWTRGYLARAGVAEPRLPAEVLLAEAMGSDRVALYAGHDRTVERSVLDRYREMVRRAAGGEPIAYITGEKEFYSLAMKVTRDVLVPRPETELLVDAAVELSRERGGRASLWDACTGSGCVAVAAAVCAPEIAVLATDICEAALAVAAENVARHGLNGRVRLAKADLLTPPAEAGEGAAFDAITANPPYVTDAQMAELPGVVQREPEIALRAGPEGLECIRRIVSDAPRRLAAGGMLAMEIGLGQAEAVYDLLNADGRYEGIRFVRDAGGIERAAVARRA